MTLPSIESQLLSEPIGQLELSNYCIVTADTTVRETIERMRTMRQNCALVVGKGTHVIGVLIDRDVLFNIVDKPETWDMPVAEFLTETPVTLPPTARTAEALRMMEKRDFRNVPVIDKNETLHGNVTHYSIMKFLTDHFPKAIYNLPPDPENYASERDGG
jgi:CBS domain-containing protein